MNQGAWLAPGSSGKFLTRSLTLNENSGKGLNILNRGEWKNRKCCFFGQKFLLRAERTETSVLEMTVDVACLKVRTARWCDYIQLIKVGGRWKIVNVLWTSGLDVPADKKAVPGFDAAKEQPAARAAAADYLEGMLAGDAVRLGRALHQETNQLVFMTAPKTNAGFVIRSRYSGLLKPAKAGTSLAPANARTAEVRVLDLMDGMAFAAARTVQVAAYLQLQLLDG